MQTHVSHTLENTQTIAATLTKDIVARFHNTKPHKAFVVGLSGELGAGKTAMVKAVARELGITQTLKSPTFILKQAFPFSIKDLPFTRLVHIDTYRLEEDDTLASIEWEAEKSDPHNLIFIEWPERVRNVLPSAIMEVSLVLHDDETRTISWQLPQKNE